MQCGTVGKVMNCKVTVPARLSAVNLQMCSTHSGTPCHYSVPQSVSLMLGHATECTAVQLVKLMRWPARAKVKGGAAYGITFWSTWSDICQMLVCLHITVIIRCMYIGLRVYCQAAAQVSGNASQLAAHLIEAHVLEPEKICNNHSRGSA